MRILITGAAGFLGSHLVEHFLKDRNNIVIGVDNMSLGSFENLKFISFEENGMSSLDSRFQLYIKDCCNYNHMFGLMQIEKPDVVYHCAATAHEGLSVFSPSFITKNIFEASVTVFSAAISSGVKRIINCSSMARYGEPWILPKTTPEEDKRLENGETIAMSFLDNHRELETVPFSEEDYTFPRDPYGIAKVAAEDVLKCLSEVHGIEYVNLVPHNIIGIRQNYTDPHRNVASIMMNRLKQGKDVIIYGDGTQTRCFSPVADVIGSLVKAGDLDNNTVTGHTINVGPDSNPISVLDLARRIYKIAGRDFDPIFVPERPREVKHAVCSSDKARRLLGYKEVQDLDSCLREMWEAIPNGGRPFAYNDKPLEIINELTPRTWTDRLI